MLRAVSKADSADATPTRFHWVQHDPALGKESETPAKDPFRMKQAAKACVLWQRLVRDRNQWRYTNPDARSAKDQWHQRQIEADIPASLCSCDLATGMARGCQNANPGHNLRLPVNQLQLIDNWWKILLRTFDNNRF